MNEDNYYWLFSAAAQAIAALIAFLMAGIALAFSMMDRLVEKDDTLYEIIDAMKRKQYSKLVVLAIATGAAILSSLLAVYLNPFSIFIRSIARGIAAFLDISVVVGSITFVASIVRPSRYTLAAQREYTVSRDAVESVFGQEPSSRFFREFISLEQDIRLYLRRNELYVPSRGTPQMSFSFRQMVDALYQNERISAQLKDLLFEVNKFRNLIFHGHLEQVDEGVIKVLQRANATWEKEKRERKESYQ